MNPNLHKILGGTGFGLFVFGLFGTLYLFPKIINSQLHANIDLKEGTMSYEAWEKQPFPLKFKVYFFNVTNAAEVQLGAKPILKELGPYVYDEYRERVDIKLNEEKDALKYILKKYYHFNKKESGGFDQDDVVTIINAALVGTALQVQLLLPTAMSMVADAVPYLYPGAKDVFLTAKVRNLLFEGITIHCTDPAVDFICGAMKGTLPKTIQLAPNGKDFIFSMFHHLNATDGGPWEMERGLKNSSRGEVLSFENQEMLDIWQEDSTCNMINGSDSSVFELPKKKRVQRIYAFSEDFCRSVFIEYEKEDKMFGMKAVRYSNTAGPFNYDSGEMRCFCPFMEDDEGEEHQVCPPNGVADVTPCMKAPILLSFPHFYLGDPKLLDYAVGLKPKKELHEIYALIEPVTASPLAGKKRVQLNIQVKPIDDFPLLENVSSGVFPIIWIDEGVILPDDFVHILTSNFLKIKFVNAMKIFMMIIGLALSATGGILTMKKERLLCFENNDTADITTVKGKQNASSSAKTDVPEGGNINPAFEGNAGLYPRREGAPLPAINGNNNAMRQMGQIGQNIRNNAQQWNAQVWHSGESNGN